MRTSAAGNRRAARSGGFTLLELLVTLAIIGVLAGLAAPAIASRFLEDPLAHSARLLKGVFEEARRDAATGGEAVAVAWLSDEHRFELAGGRTLQIPPEVEVSFTGGGRHLALPGGGTAPGLLFHPLGGSSGGSVLLRSGTARALLVVDPLTGYVRYGDVP